MSIYNARGMAIFAPYAICLTTAIGAGIASAFLLPSPRTLDNIVESANVSETRVTEAQAGEQKSSAAYVASAIVAATTLAFTMAVTSCVVNYREGRRQNRNDSVRQ